MSETRYDWLADRWVIFAPHRAQRPDEFVQKGTMPRSGTIQCPFCQGHEDQTPHDVLTLPRTTDNVSGWQVRVVPNKYPALAPLPDFLAPASRIVEPSQPEERAELRFNGANLLYQRRTIHGAHEVIIESPKHINSLTELSEPEAVWVFEAYRRRLLHWRAHEALRYSVVFKNVGPEAGASLSHSHSQLISTNLIPPDVLRCCRRLQEYYEEHDRGYFEEILACELACDDRIICQSPHFVAFVPYASQLPYFIWILPRSPQARFEEISDPHLKEFAHIVRRVLGAVESHLPNAAYNFVLHTSPFEACWEQAYHWRLEIFPRLTKVAGFEWGSDCFINPVLPELAARELAKWT